jgi:hypothetical protein
MAGSYSRIREIKKVLALDRNFSQSIKIGESFHDFACHCRVFSDSIKENR